MSAAEATSELGGVSPARRPAGARPHIAFLDGIRALAVLAILVRHAWGLSGSPYLPVLGVDLRPVMVMLSSGVDLFFVLSGYLLSQSYFARHQAGRPQPRYRTYWKARILRIGPPYWVILVLVVMFMTPTFIPPERVFSMDGLAIFGAHVALLQTTFISSFGAYSVETPFWTLTIEMIFYALLPYLVRLFYGRRWIGTIPGFVAVAVGWLVMVRDGAPWLVDLVNGPLNVFGPFPESAVRFFLSHQFPAFLVDFGLGIGVSLLVTSKRLALRRHAMFQRLTSPAAGILLLAVGVAVLLTASWVLGTLSIRNGYADPLQYMNTSRRADVVYYYLETIPFGIGFAALLAGVCLGPEWLRRVFSLRPLAYVGLIGYSVYLIHMPILRLFNTYPWLASEFDPSTHFIKLMLAGGAAVMTLSIGFFYAVERPAMSWSKRARDGDRSRPGPTVLMPQDGPGSASVPDDASRSTAAV